MSLPNEIAGTAALAICEALLLALNDHKILPEREIVGVLKDAAASHENAPTGDHDALHAGVAELINGINAGATPCVDVDRAKWEKVGVLVVLPPV